MQAGVAGEPLAMQFDGENPIALEYGMQATAFLLVRSNPLFCRFKKFSTAFVPQLYTGDFQPVHLLKVYIEP
ncbi:MAG: hypothetical protein PHF57_03075 [Methanoregula sp.]|jgi:hypothetical protein|nr:hypothetical protein [Methanoregula sp.]